MKTTTILSKLVLPHPIIGASGPFGYLHEWSNDMDLNQWAALTLKTTTPLPRLGNETPRMAEVTSGMLNSIGLQNPGLIAVKEFELQELSNITCPIIGNIGGNSIEDFLLMASAYEEIEQIKLIEVNVSCPNVKNHGVNFAHDLEALKELAQALRPIIKKPLFIKLSPNLPSLVPTALALEKIGVDGLTIANTYVGMKINLESGKPILANRTGGLSGPAIKALSLRHVYEVSQVCALPIIGLGGVESAEDVLEYIYAGATAVSIGAAILHDPQVLSTIISNLPYIMKKYNIEDLSKVRGIAWK
ncbi:MAG: dihydroorotate dehydrogenase [Bacteriovoracaceae bacterium]